MILKVFVFLILNFFVGGGYNVMMVDEVYYVMMFWVMNEIGVIDEFDEGKWYEFIGVLSRY